MTVVGALAVGAAVAVLGARAPRRVRAAAPTRERGAARPSTSARELSVVVAGAAAQLRAGAAPADAWGRALGRPIPTVAALLDRSGGPRRGRAARVQRAAAVVAAARLSDDLGAPLAAVLDRVGAALAADEECEADRVSALAGPRATAQVLAWLPLLGLLLGVALGANPVAVVLRGGVGTVAAAVGVVLVVIGRWWTSALLARAARDDDARGRR